MREVGYENLFDMATTAAGYINKIYLHWTAGLYDQKFDDYHLNITGDGRLWISCSKLTEYKEHTWHRNSSAIGIALCCCFDATAYADGTVNFGNIPPTAAQIDAMSKAVAVLCQGLNLSISPYSVMTHAEAADADGYGPATTCERWDLWKLPDIPGPGGINQGGDVIRGKAIWWQSKS